MRLPGLRRKDGLVVSAMPIRSGLGVAGELCKGSVSLRNRSSLAVDGRRRYRSADWGVPDRIKFEE